MVRPARRDPTPRFYFSLRSPYSWLAHHDLVTHYPEVAESVQWRPFWEPDRTSQRLLADAGGSFPYVENSRPKARYILQDVRRLADHRGLRVTWPVDRRPHWEVAHLAYLVAARHGQGRQFIAHTYQARWQRGEDISDPVTIGRIAGELGLPAAALTGAVDDPQVRAEGLEALLALDVDGVFGVPFFVVGYDKFWGVDRLSLFAAAVRRAGSPVRGDGQEPADADPPGGDTSAVGTDAAADQGHAGGCG
jgi:2-hydroxychromene-2-carboxylate isomerase